MDEGQGSNHDDAEQAVQSPDDADESPDESPDEFPNKKRKRKRGKDRRYALLASANTKEEAEKFIGHWEMYCGPADSAWERVSKESFGSRGGGENKKTTQHERWEHRCPHPDCPVYYTIFHKIANSDDQELVEKDKQTRRRGRKALSFAAVIPNADSLPFQLCRNIIPKSAVLETAEGLREVLVQHTHEPGPVQSAVGLPSFVRDLVDEYYGIAGKKFDKAGAMQFLRKKEAEFQKRIKDAKDNLRKPDLSADELKSLREILEKAKKDAELFQMPSESKVDNRLSTLHKHKHRGAKASASELSIPDIVAFLQSRMLQGGIDAYVATDESSRDYDKSFIVHMELAPVNMRGKVHAKREQACRQTSGALLSM